MHPAPPRVFHWSPRQRGTIAASFVRPLSPLNHDLAYSKSKGKIASSDAVALHRDFALRTVQNRSYDDLRYRMPS